MRYLPMGFDTENKNVLVLGGGLLALSKIKDLIDTNFKIYVIADSFVDEVLDLQKKYSERFFIKEEVLTEEFIFFNYDYLIIATNDFVLNSAFEKRAKKSGILYERCDILSESDLIINKAISKNGITIGLDTHKMNPAIKDIIVKDLDEFLNRYNPEKLNLLNDIRSELVRKNSPDIDETIKKLYTEEKITIDSYLKEIKKSEDKKDNFKNPEDAKKEINIIEDNIKKDDINLKTDIKDDSNIEK